MLSLILQGESHWLYRIVLRVQLRLKQNHISAPYNTRKQWLSNTELTIELLQRKSNPAYVYLGFNEADR